MKYVNAEDFVDVRASRRSVFNENTLNYFGGRKLMFASCMAGKNVHGYVTFEKYVPRFYYADSFSGKILITSLSRKLFPPRTTCGGMKTKVLNEISLEKGRYCRFFIPVPR